MSATRGLSRRDWLKICGAGGLTVFFGTEAPSATAGGEPALAPNAWVRVTPDGAIEVRISKTEMGQGTETGLAMIVADELDADWARVRVRTLVPDGRRFMLTGGSYSISVGWEPARKAAAAAREMLLAAGASRWGVPREACRTERHEVAHAASGRRIPYGELVQAAAALPVPKTPALKTPGQFTLIGRPLAAKNLPAIVGGHAVYGIDVRVPGMLFAVIERAPTVNGRIAQVHDDDAKAVPGVLAVVRLRGNRFPTGEVYVRDGVAVVARTTWAALQGRARLRVQWQQSPADTKAANGALASSAELARDFARALDGTATQDPPHAIHPAVTAARTGTPEAMVAAFERASQRLELHYELPLQAHAPLEPVNAVAHWQGGRCELWAGTHFQSRLLQSVRELTGLPPERITIHTPMLGGSFGRRLEPDYAVEALMLSREIERPVQVLWTREDDMRCGLFAPPSRHRVRVALGPRGRLLALDHAFATLSVRRQTDPSGLPASGLDGSASFDAVKFPYAADTVHVRHHLVDQAIRVFWWRRGYSANHSFVNETLLDECAHAAGVDALAYRLELLGQPRVLDYDNDGEPERIDTARLGHALREACRAAGWGRAMPEGTGLGLAATVTDTHLAQVVEVDARQGAPRVVRVWCAVDCGRVINPQLVAAQVEGCVAFALTAALKGSITVEAGQVQQSNFHDYPLLRMDDMPQVHTLLIDSDAAPTGIGEHAAHPTAAALANAWFAATGQRQRVLPFAAI